MATLQRPKSLGERNQKKKKKRYLVTSLQMRKWNDMWT